MVYVNSFAYSAVKVWNNILPDVKDMTGYIWLKAIIDSCKEQMVGQ